MSLTTQRFFLFPERWNGLRRQVRKEEERAKEKERTVKRRGPPGRKWDSRGTVKTRKCRALRHCVGNEERERCSFVLPCLGRREPRATSGLARRLGVPFFSRRSERFTSDRPSSRLQLQNGKLSKGLCLSLFVFFLPSSENNENRQQVKKKQEKRDFHAK